MALSIQIKTRSFCFNPPVTTSSARALGVEEPSLRVRSRESGVDSVTSDLNGFDTSSFCFSFWVVLLRVQSLAPPGPGSWLIYGCL